MIVRRAGPGDKAAWLALWRAWQDHMSGNVPGHVTAAAWQKMLIPDSGLFAMMVWQDETALGFANVSVTPFAWTGEDILFLQDFFISSPARGRGLGTALLKGVYAEADRLKAHQVFWMVDEGDPELQAFYDRHARRSPYVRYLRSGWPW